MKKAVLLSIGIGLTIMSQAEKPSCCAPDQFAKFANDPAFIKTHITPIKMSEADHKGIWLSINYAPNKFAKAYLTQPKKMKAHSALLVFHEWWGLNDYIQNETDKLSAELGIPAMAIDLYGGKVASTPEEAGQLMKAVNSEESIKIIHTAMDFLKNNFKIKAQRFGTIGWCFGGGWSLQAAIEGGDKVAACVIYYGAPEMNDERIQMLKAPVLAHYGEKDNWLNHKLIDPFEAKMKANSRSIQVNWYEADHGFANPSNPKHNKEATSKATARTVAFLKKHLIVKH